MDLLVLGQTIFFFLASVALIMFIVLFSMIVYFQIKFYRKMEHISKYAKEFFKGLVSTFYLFKKKEKSFWEKYFD